MDVPHLESTLHASYESPEMVENSDVSVGGGRRRMSPDESLEAVRLISARTEEGSESSWRLLRRSDLLTLCLTAPKANEADAEAVARMPDLAALIHRGDQAAVEDTFARTVRAIWMLVHQARHFSRTSVRPEVRARLLERFCTRYLGEEKILRNLAAALVSENLTLEEEVLSLSGQRRSAVLKALVCGCKDASDLKLVLGPKVALSCLAEFSAIAFSPLCRAMDLAARLGCYLASCLNESEMLGLLEKALVLWGDPVIARAHLTREVVHCAKLVLLLFSHSAKAAVLRRESRLIELLVKGLPNHFNSADGRTVEMAKYLSEVLTETLKWYGNEAHQLPEHISRPPDEFCAELVRGSIHSCDRTQDFWMKPSNVILKVEQARSPPGDQDSKKTQVIDSDDDDSSDLEQIESLDPVKETKIKYLRNFLEDVPEMKGHEEVLQAFQALPNITRNQLVHEHVSVGLQILDFVFLWENEFEDPVLDKLRKTSLVSVVATRPVDYVRPFCLMFHRDHVQPYRKNIILEVLGEASKELDLKNLQLLTETVFSSLLLHDGTVAEQDVTVRIPLILFLSQTICRLPPQMVTEDMLLGFMASVKNLAHVDGATEQTVCYSLNAVMTALGQTKISPKVREGVIEARNWILAMQMNR